MSSECLFAANSTVWVPYYVAKSVTNITIVLVKMWLIQLQHSDTISGDDSSCSWVYCSCTGPIGGTGADLVDCNAVWG